MMEKTNLLGAVLFLMMAALTFIQRAATGM